MNKGLDLIQRQQIETIDGYPTGNVYIGLTSEELEELEKELRVLEQYKNIEKELGINSIILCKALKDGAWFRNPYYLGEINYIKNLEFNIDFDKKRFDIRMDYFVKFYDYRTGGAFFLFKDYGKTWALKREELE